MNQNHWISQAREHWKERRPTYFKELHRKGKPCEVLQSAAEATYREMNDLEEAGYSNQEEWEMARETYLFRPGEPEKGEVESRGAALLNEAHALQSEILQMLRKY